jgi:hypothetical protein
LVILEKADTNIEISNPCTDLDIFRELQEIEAPKIFRKSAHEGGNVVSPTQTGFSPTKMPAIYFSQEDETTPGR